MKPKKRPAAAKHAKSNPMFASHDPLEALELAERAQEDVYFRKVDQELIAALRQKNAEEVEKAIKQYTHMRCPACGAVLHEVSYRKIKVDECADCGGIWLDQGELETLAGPREGPWQQRLFEAFLTPGSRSQKT
ncbi:MAG: hypothetical protein ETSY1_07755 [Candidatus Entotheonella factor]|uniref:Transcription factor zinc-finger domain-containing protein n=1 Tax=Entotheonella factor TaxID=1429438 RepID=W4LTN7_ENTF1|nr:MAG: hypothetical protein ETSY1_07755 [Candidatus Entotheonella factor]